MLHKLPTEIALLAISYLPLHSLQSTAQVSREWNALIALNESTVCRNAAILHRFTNGDENSTLATDWKSYCRRQLEIERGWRGKAPFVARELTATGLAVHRIKVDYELNLIITTCQTGGLFVCNIKNDTVLWSLPVSHVVPYAHCEYDRGYIVFNRNDNCKEVWRRAADAEGVQPPEISPPDQEMLEVSTQAAVIFRSAECRWGHFKPWALLRCPEDSRAFRLSYPALLVSAKNNAYVWDVCSSQLVLVVRDIQRSHRGVLLGTIHYVEVNDVYVFICGDGGLRIFAREDGALLYQLSTMAFHVATLDVWTVLPQSCTSSSSVLNPQMLVQNFPSTLHRHDEFIACHVSQSGNDLAVLTSNGRLVLLHDFQCLFSGSDTVCWDNVVVLNFQPCSNGVVSHYLSIGNRSGKLAIATRKGIYVIATDFGFSRLTADRPAEPGVSVCRLSGFDNDRFLSSISCLQITDDAMYFTYKSLHTTGAPNTVHQMEEHHFFGAHGAHEVQVPLIEGVFEDGWEDEEEEEEEEDDEMGFGAAEDDGPIHPIIANWFWRSTMNTVHVVSF